MDHFRVEHWIQHSYLCSSEADNGADIKLAYQIVSAQEVAVIDICIYLSIAVMRK